eukprot:5551451-Amphidinium_carterae.1
MAEPSSERHFPQQCLPRDGALERHWTDAPSAWISSGQLTNTCEVLEQWSGQNPSELMLQSLLLLLPKSAGGIGATLPAVLLCRGRETVE